MEKPGQCSASVKLPIWEVVMATLVGGSSARAITGTSVQFIGSESSLGAATVLWKIVRQPSVFSTEPHKPMILKPFEFYGTSAEKTAKPNLAVQRTPPQCHPCCLLRGLRCQHGRHRGGVAELGH